ncbi:hypothetical protein HUJ04_000560 [Dendroctonus ponderosae]|nr:hypothetical protein HUJ04_000560 [Dendroctonus ponderosae]
MKAKHSKRVAGMIIRSRKTIAKDGVVTYYLVFNFPSERYDHTMCLLVFYYCIKRYVLNFRRFKRCYLSFPIIENNF